MIHTDRDRLLVGIGVALVLHLALFTGLAIAGLDFTPYPESSPVFVTLPDYERSPQTQEPEPVPEEPEPVEPTETPEEVAPAEPTPAEPTPEEPAPAPDQAPELATESAREPQPAARTDPAPSTQAREPAPVGTDAPEGSFGTEDLPWLDDEATDRERPRRSNEELFAQDEPAETESELPSWIVEGEFSLQPESSLDQDSRETLESKRDTVPGFEKRLGELVAALENPPRSAPDESDGGDGGIEGDTSGPGTTPTRLPGGGMIEWVGSGTRRPVGDLPLPELTATDFGGEVPARISYLVVFEVNENGLVVPGSLILRQSSGYTLADQKVRRAISSWRFDPAPGSAPVTAIATLHIARDQVR